jgi:hypothetical protein
MASSSHWSDGSGRLIFVSFYLFFGLIHEFAHIFFARLLFASDDLVHINDEMINSGGVISVLFKALFGRYCIVSLSADNSLRRAIVLHSGWISTLTLGVCLHLYYRRLARIATSNKTAYISWMSIAAVAAYITALEGTITDLFGFIPASWSSAIPSTEGRMILYCGNFGVILLNSSWINQDGGKKALDMLEKMVEVTMMRGE